MYVHVDIAVGGGTTLNHRPPALTQRARSFLILKILLFFFIVQFRLCFCVITA